MEEKCIENASCFRIHYKGIEDNNEPYDKYLISIKIKNGEGIEVSYTFTNDYNSANISAAIDYISKNIKITNDASYLIGKVTDNELVLNLKSDTNEKDNAYVNLIFDKNKYMEIEDGYNDINHTRLTTSDNKIIDIYVQKNSRMDEKGAFNYLYYERDLNFFVQIDSKKENKDYESSKRDGKIIYKHSGKYIGTIYGIENGTNSMFIIRFHNSNDDCLLEDFMNYTSGINN